MRRVRAPAVALMKAAAEPGNVDCRQTLSRMTAPTETT